MQRAPADLVDYCAVVGWIASGKALSSRIYFLIWDPCFSRFCVTIFIYIKRETKILLNNNLNGEVEEKRKVDNSPTYIENKQ